MKIFHEISIYIQMDFVFGNVDLNFSEIVIFKAFIRRRVLDEPQT